MKKSGSRGAQERCACRTTLARYGIARHARRVCAFDARDASDAGAARGERGASFVAVAVAAGRARCGANLGRNGRAVTAASDAEPDTVAETENGARAAVLAPAAEADAHTGADAGTDAATNARTDAAADTRADAAADTRADLNRPAVADADAGTSCDGPPRSLGLSRRRYLGL